MFLRYLTDQGLIACFLDKTVYEGKQLGISSSEEINLLRIGRLYQLGRMHPNFRGFYVVGIYNAVSCLSQQKLVKRNLNIFFLVPNEINGSKIEIF